MKVIEITLSERVERLGNKLYQNFFYNKKDKNTKFFLDKRYLLYDKFNRHILNRTLSCEELDFIKSINNEDGVSLEYLIKDESIVDKIQINKTKYKTIIDVIPDYPGCSFCIYRKKLTDVFYECVFKNKALNKDIKNCKWFQQKELW
jgi:hypothetical protein